MLTALICCCAAILSACSVSQETTPVAVQLDGTVAKSQASALSTAVASAQADDGLAIAEALASVGDIAAALLPPTKNGARQRLKHSTTTCACDAATKSCTFDACTIGNATVSGALSWSAGEIRCTNLAFDVAATSAAIGAAKVTVSCAVTYATGQLAGNVHTAGNAVVDGVTYTWEASLVAGQVTFASKAFTGGAIAVDATVTASGSAGDKTYSANATMSLP
jgi:hypothetical protein